VIKMINEEKTIKGLIPEDIEGLYPVTCTYTPVNCDWGELGYENFEVVQPFNMEDYEDEDRYYEECESNYPMMNYYYPLPDFKDFGYEDALKINHLNLCLVYFTEKEEYALALTGGGMDLSWDIVEAYIRLGYYPPTHFDLPNFAGMPNDMHRRCIINACIGSREIVKGWMDNDIKDLENLTKYLIKSNPRPE